MIVTRRAFAGMVASAAMGSETFSAGFMIPREEHLAIIPILGAAHRNARVAIKSVRPELSVGLSLAVSDDQASGKPILTTEHGLGIADDSFRVPFIFAAIEGLRSAIAEGVPVLGYIHWSLLDNFEWYSGYAPRFGLVEVDRKSFKRTPKPSAFALGAVARKNGD